MTTRNDPSRPKSNTDHDFEGMTKREYMVMNIAAGLIAREPNLPLDKVADLAVKYSDQIFDKLEAV